MQTEEDYSTIDRGTESISKWESDAIGIRPSRTSGLVTVRTIPIRTAGHRVTPTSAARVPEKAASRSNTLWVNGGRKRALDVSFGVAAMIVTSPLLAAIAVAIKVSSRGPVLFRQERMGMGGRTFTILKFRTMRVQDGPLVTARNDARITKVGRWLRRAKLDELPQMVNVLRGDMSLVGPRPKISGHQNTELICRPGLTGAATLAFIEEEKLLVTVPEDKLESYVVDVLHRIKSEVDHEYALGSTFRSDLRLLCSTVLHLFRIRRSGRVQAMNDRVRQSCPR